MEFEGKCTITQALDALDGINIRITRATLIEWCRKHDLGIQLGPKGPWMVHLEKLKEFVTKGTYKKEEDKPSTG